MKIDKNISDSFHESSLSITNAFERQSREGKWFLLQRAGFVQDFCDKESEKNIRFTRKWCGHVPSIAAKYRENFV